MTIKKNHKIKTIAPLMMGALATSHVQAALIDEILQKDTATIAAESKQLSTNLSDELTQSQNDNKIKKMGEDSYYINAQNALNKINSIDYMKTLTDHEKTQVRIDGALTALTYNLKNNVQQHSEDIANLNYAVGTLAIKTATDITEIKSTADEAKADADEAKNTADEAKTTAEQSKKDIAALDTRVTTVEGVAAKNTSDIAALDTRVTTVEETVAQHTTDIANINTQIANHTKQINQLNNRIDYLEEKTENGLAAQAALTGLFQPYNVGKFNVSGAIGGYKSKTAIAIGAGYRFDEQTAIKAGIATSTRGGGASYNVGVNFEW